MKELSYMELEEFTNIFIDSPDGFVPNPTDNGKHCRGNGEYDLECQCEGCEVALDCYSKSERATF